MAVAEAAAAAAIGTSRHQDGASPPSAADDAAGSAAGDNPQPLVVADLPGLVPGAHTGKGRGTDFLAHLQRARCLALVLDMTGSNEQQEQQQQQQQTSAEQGSGMVDGAAASSAAVASRGPAGKEAAEGDGWGVLVPYTPQEQLAILQVRAAARSVGIVQRFHAQEAYHAAIVHIK
jgi:hypothetical protein